MHAADHRRQMRRENQADLVLAQHRQQQLIAGIEPLHVALRFSPEFLPAYTALANMLALAHHSEEAVQVAQQGIEVANAGGATTIATKLQELIERLQSQATTK